MNEQQKLILPCLVSIAGLPIPNMDGDDIFKDVLPEESQNSHEPIIAGVTNNSVSTSKFAMNANPAIVQNQHGVIIQQNASSMMATSHSGKIIWARSVYSARSGSCFIVIISCPPVIQNNMNMAAVRNVPSTPTPVVPQQQSIPSPATYPAASPYHSEYST